MEKVFITTATLLLALCPAESEGLEVTGLVGGWVEFKCSHIFAKRNKKYFCKDTCTGSDILVQTEDSKNCIKTGRYSIDDRGDGDFTVTINHLKTSDSGTYWCGVDRLFIDSSQEVLLTVQDAPLIQPDITRTSPCPPVIVSRTTAVITTVEPNTTITTTTTTAPATTTILSLSSSSSSSSSSLYSSPSSSSLSSTLNGSGTSVVIMVSVSLVVLLLVISLIIVYRWKYSKATGSVSSTHRVCPDTGNNEGVCHGDGDYEEIKECPLRSDSGAATTTIYATANLPTSHSDSPHYATVNFHKIPSSPNEATATITKEGSCSNEATAAIDIEGTSSCDYATVNFVQSPAYYCQSSTQLL